MKSALKQQQTIRQMISCEGIGLHSGHQVSLTLHPAPAGTGIVFVRTDIEGEAAKIPARFDAVSDTRLSTTIQNRFGTSISTIEHVMSALYGLDVDNAYVLVSGPEVPIMDGSSQSFADMIAKVGLAPQNGLRRAVRILKEIRVQEGDAWATLTPAQDFQIELEIDFSKRGLASQKARFTPSQESYLDVISTARTFCFEEDVVMMRQAGLALGGSLDNAVVIGSGDQVLNEDGLRFDNEFVRHKILDAVGDLGLAGAPILGHFAGFKSGHRVNNLLLRALFADQTAWCYDPLLVQVAKPAREQYLSV